MMPRSSTELSRAPSLARTKNEANTEARIPTEEMCIRDRAYTMPRKPRIHFPGAIYHVITRGNNQDTIFAGKKDKHYYLEKLKEFSRNFYFDLLIYAIMDLSLIHI